MAEKRAHWHKQLAVEPVAALVFVDESGANTKMTCLRGRALGGRRLLAHIPHGPYETSTLISGLRLEGHCAPWLFGGSMNGEMFLAWVRQGLAPTLRPGDEFSGFMEGLLAAGVAAWRKNMLACTQVGVYFPSPEGRNVNSG